MITTLSLFFAKFKNYIIAIIILLGLFSYIFILNNKVSELKIENSLNENSIKEIDDIIDHHNFYSLCEYTIKFNVDIKNILTKFANLLRDALKIAYIDAPLLTEIRS